MAARIGIDVGGTFTDFILTRDDAPPVLHKVLSTPADPSIAVVTGLTELAAMVAPAGSVEAFAAAIDTIVHGTTVATNATLTATGAKSALLTTEGVRDALEMRRGIREEQYNNAYTNVKPLVPRHLRIGVKGRLDRAGRELVPLSHDDVRRALRLLPAGGRGGGLDLLHELVRQPGARGGGRGAGARSDARRVPHRLVRAAAVDPVLRAAVDDRAQFLRRAEAQRLHGEAREPPWGDRLSRPPADHAKQRRRDGAGSRAQQAGADAAVGARRRSGRGPLLRPGAGPEQGDHHRHGRHQLRGLGGGRCADPRQRRRDRAAQDRAADARHPHDRRGRRLDRLDRSGRSAADGPAQRRRRSGPRVLHEGRHAAGLHRRQPRAGLSRSRLFRRRADAAVGRRRPRCHRHPHRRARWGCRWKKRRQGCSAWSATTWRRACAR